jgi:putative spermidine/putrescine transport system ATP-binding protein
VTASTTSSSTAQHAGATPFGHGIERSGVEFTGVVKQFGSQRVLHGVDLAVRPGELVSLLGPSGCGKSTALRLLAGLEHLDGGRITIAGRDMVGVPTNRRDIGMVFQSYSLFPHLTVARNTAFGLRTRKVAGSDVSERVAAALELVGLSALAGRYPHQLSGGQQQRVALARALVTEPQVLLLDEPLSALDAKVRLSLREEIRRIQQRLGITTIFVTHDQEEALAVSDRIAVMNTGSIEQLGTPEDLYLRPATPFVADFIGRSSLAPATVAGGEALLLGQRVPLLQPRQDGPAMVYLRPENVMLASQGAPGIVVGTSYLGAVRRTQVRTEDGTELVIQHAAGDAVAPGQLVRLQVMPVPVVATDPEP